MSSSPEVGSTSKDAWLRHYEEAARRRRAHVPRRWRRFLPRRKWDQRAAILVLALGLVIIVVLLGASALLPGDLLPGVR